MKEKRALEKIKKMIEKIGLIPPFDEQLLYSMERQYFDDLNIFDLQLEKNNAQIEPDESVRMYKVSAINHLGNVDYGLHLQNFSNLLAVLKNPSHTVFSIIKGSENTTELYYGIAQNLENKILHTQRYFDGNFLSAFKSNYPGLSYNNLEAISIKREIKKIGKYKKINAISGIPSLREKDKKEIFPQGIDRFIEGMQGSDYMLLTIVEPIPLKIIDKMIKNLYDHTSEIHRQVKSNVLISNTPLSVGAFYFVGASISLKKPKTISQEMLNKKAEYAEQLCNEYISRLQSGKNLGFWNVGIYLLSDNDYQQYKGSGLLSSILSGDKTHFEPIRSLKLSENTKEEYLQHFKNPRFKTFLYGFEDDTQAESDFLKNLEDLKKNKNVRELFENMKKPEKKNREKFEDIINNIKKEVKPALKEMKENKSAHPLGAIMGGVSTPLNTEELAIIMNMPRKEINGIPVLQKTEFGRNIVTFNNRVGKEIDIGELRYMGKPEHKRLNLNLNSMTGHTFITGSTGSGKSNTVYNILDKLVQNKINFLIIEPAKGEYKKVFGGIDNVNVFGTNLKYTELLRINPFKFPEEIHVLEHLDRLIEIFNATWPMYAAMPALLKEAMEKAYKEKGWDLENSLFLKDKKEYPTVKDLVNVMPSIIKNSGYSDEIQANYYGALVSRLKSLKNGLYRQILTENEIENQKLFDENCIIDLSRIGSMETKSLLMGIVFMRMYEYRLSNAKEMNKDLEHITVIEEAHNLIRKTSFEQNEEYSNIQGKAVEMITNSIAEMRTYGEGFILVDQAPTLLDSTAIRNTNTKIILRLPDQKDKEVVGLSANLNDEQIRELSRLETGEAVVYQNDWLQAVSCKIDLRNKRKPLKYDGSKKNEEKRKNISELLLILISPIVSEESKSDFSKVDIEKLKKWLLGYPLNQKVKYIILEILEKQEEHQIYNSENFEKLANIVGHFFNFEEYLPSIKKEDNIEKWNKEILSSIKIRCKMPNDELQIELLHLLMCDFAHQKNVEHINKFYFSWVEKTIGIRG